MDREELRDARGEVVEQLVNIETVMNALISQHYLGRVDLRFLKEVLHNPGCSFALRRDLLAYAAPEFGQGNLREDLCRLGNIRNYFAHVGMAIYEVGKGEEQEPFFPDPKRPERSIDFDALLQELRDKTPAVTQALFQAMTEKGIQLSLHP